MPERPLLDQYLCRQLIATGMIVGLTMDHCPHSAHRISTVAGASRNQMHMWIHYCLSSSSTRVHAHVECVAFSGCNHSVTFGQCRFKTVSDHCWCIDSRHKQQVTVGDWKEITKHCHANATQFRCHLTPGCRTHSGSMP